MHSGYWKNSRGNGLGIVIKDYKPIQFGIWENGK